MRFLELSPPTKLITPLGGYTAPRINISWPVPPGLIDSYLLEWYESVHGPSLVEEVPIDGPPDGPVNFFIGPPEYGPGGFNDGFDGPPPPRGPVGYMERIVYTNFYEHSESVSPGTMYTISIQSRNQGRRRTMSKWKEFMVQTSMYS